MKNTILNCLTISLRKVEPQILQLVLLLFPSVSVYILLDSGHPAKVGECQITFCEVLDHPRNTLHGTVPVLLAHDDADEAQHLPSGLDIQAGQVRFVLVLACEIQIICNWLSSYV